MEELEFRDLLNMAAANQRDLNVPADVFRRKFSTVHIEYVYMESRGVIAKLFEKLGIFNKRANLRDSI